MVDIIIITELSVKIYLHICEIYIDLGLFLIIFTYMFGMPNIKQQHQTIIMQANLTFVFLNERITVMNANKSSTNLSYPLSDCYPGNEGTVAEVAGPARFAARLRELGLLPGVRVRLLRSGSALVVQVGETRLAIRRRDAESIRVCTDLAFAPKPTANLTTS
ncbi:MAG: FeoA family protein [Candidatus Latescibacterota bacterium]|jgi:Fe2+ transport system protein FeoA